MTENMQENVQENVQKNIIEVKNLTKTFGVDSSPLKVEAVKGINFSVRKGEIFGFLGPNGAGKTTTLSMLSTLLFPTSGTATIDGNDIEKEPDLVRKNIGMVFQETSLDIDLTGFENMELHAIMYGLDKKTRTRRIKEMFEIVKLTEKAKTLVKNYSGGMKRRLEIARGLLHYPNCLFLDEPTLGLDPQTRRSIWEHIKKLNQEYGITIILTTHYMEEADELCDRICIIDHGEIIALGTSENLKAQLKGDTISIEFENTKDLRKFKKKIKDFPGINAIKLVAERSGGMPNFQNMPGRPPMAGKMSKAMMGQMQQMQKMREKMQEHQATKLNITIENGSEKIPGMIKIANDTGIQIKSLTIKQPSLEDVFIYYTGRSIREQEGEGRMGMIRQMIQTRMRAGGGP
ncbi:MAG: ATP-binding cassette domain-containing protein [Candidatus Helarchaeota archaeon]